MTHQQDIKQALNDLHLELKAVEHNYLVLADCLIYNCFNFDSRFSLTYAASVAVKQYQIM